MRIITRIAPKISTLIVLLSLLACGSEKLPEGDLSLFKGFQDPPHKAKPTVYYTLLNGYVNTEFVDTELEEFARMGVGGLLVFDMGIIGNEYAFPPAGPEFMSESWLDNFARIVDKAETLGMSVDLAACSSWDMGASWVRPEEAVMALYQNSFTVSGPQKLRKQLPYPELPPTAILDESGKPLVANEVAVLAIPIQDRQPAYEFMYKLGYDFPHQLDQVILTNCINENPQIAHGENIFTKDFSIALSSSGIKESDFTEVLKGSLEANTEKQSFSIAGSQARYVRLRIYSGHHPESEYVQLGEFEVISNSGESLIHRPYNKRFDGGMELGFNSQLGNHRLWTANNLNDGVLSGNAGSWISNGLPPALIKDINDIQLISSHLDQEGMLEWDVPEGEWEIIRYFSTNTGERLKIPNPASDGLATDHLSAEATRNYINYLADKLEDRFGPLDESVIGTFYLPSYEVRGKIWTKDMPELFKEYRGYELVKYLPALDYYVIENQEITDRFLYDYQKTMGELLVDAFYRTASETAEERGMAIKAESAGPGPPIHMVPVEALSALNAVKEIQGEFWPWREHWDDLWVVKETASAAHVYGKELVHMESFTGFRHWQDGPLDLKPSADRAFCEGMNHIVWHMGEHNPPEAGKPGWVYHAGSHFNLKLVWWEQMKPWMDYLTRTSYLLQQGLFVGDVVYYYGDKGANFIKPKHTNTSLNPGYDYDVCNLEVMLTRMEVKDHKLVLPDGMSYEVLVLPLQNDITLEALERIEELVDEGATVIGPKPELSTGLQNYRENDAAVQELAEKLWDKIISDKSVNEILAERNIVPDFQYEGQDPDIKLDFIHRRTPSEDIYFIRNTRSVPASFSASFRVRGKTPERWHPDTGERSKQLVYTEDENGITFDLALEEYGSLFVVFTSDCKGSHISSVSGENTIDNIHNDSLFITSYKNGSYELTRSEGTTTDFQVKNIPPSDRIEGEWKLSFLNRDMGAPDSTKTRELKSLSEFQADGIRYYSGITRYEIDFQVDSSKTAPDIRSFLDLGALWLLADLHVNGSFAGTLWKSPWQMEITNLIKPGRNKLVIDVANTWCNRLIGDALNPQDTPFCRTNIGGNETKEANSWLKVPLRESGLFGPVEVFYARKQQIPLN